MTTSNGATRTTTMTKRLARAVLIAGLALPTSALLGGLGPIAAVEEGDTITIDIENRTIDVALTSEEIQKRMAKWKAPERRYKTGVFAKYVAAVSSASEGAITSQVG